MCGQSVNQGANVEFRGRFKWHRLFQIGSGCSLWWAGGTSTTAQLRQVTSNKPPRANADAAMPASRGLKHETCFLTDPTHPRADEGTSNFIHTGCPGGKRRLEPQFFQDFSPSQKDGVRDNLSRFMLNGISWTVRNPFNLDPS